MGSSKGSASHILLFIVGLIIGGIAAGTIVFFTSREENQSNQTTVESSGIILTIDTPTNRSVVSQETLSIEGSTGKDAIVAVIGSVEEKIIQTSEGRFSTDLKLTEGENRIQVSAFDIKTGENTQTSFSVLYLDEGLAASSEKETDSQAETTSSEENVDKLKQQLSTASAQVKDKALGLPETFVSGTLVATTNPLLWLENDLGFIQTISTDDLTSFYTISDKGKEKTKLEDLKTGNRLLAAGTSSEEVSGNAKYIIRTDKKIKTKHALLGKVTSISGKNISLTFTSQEGKIFEVVADDKSKVLGAPETNPTLEDIGEEDILVTIGSLNKEGVLLATTIYVALDNKPIQEAPSPTPSATAQ